MKESLKIEHFLKQTPSSALKFDHDKIWFPIVGIPKKQEQYVFYYGQEALENNHLGQSTIATIQSSFKANVVYRISSQNAISIPTQLSAKMFFHEKNRKDAYDY
ncbi:hypothetical protein BpHYR1_006386 [Brachionus plicatilis]|uniref:Uncharacterized protein n=1 Tax=Brachionus plicatilis TaxID=10195 RepID=A0A3M7R6G8_BRAPC|nr:hypothetical protein BpHYR1_006386 [Brachionus plicatilis]